MIGGVLLTTISLAGLFDRIIDHDRIPSAFGIGQRPTISRAIAIIDLTLLLKPTFFKIRKEQPETDVPIVF